MIFLKDTGMLLRQISLVPKKKKKKKKGKGKGKGMGDLCMYLMISNVGMLYVCVKGY